MSALWTRCDQPRTTFFAEFGSVTVLMLALRTVHSPPYFFTRHNPLLSAISTERSEEKP